MEKSLILLHLHRQQKLLLNFQIQNQPHINVNLNGWQLVNILFHNYYNDLVNNNIGISITTLWTNPDITISFSPQNITIDKNMSNYRFIACEYMYNISQNPDNHMIEFTSYGNGLWLNLVGSTTQGRRVIEFIDNNTLNISEAKWNDSISNGYCIPIKIYGIK